MSSSQIFGLLLVALLIFAGIYVASHTSVITDLTNGKFLSFGNLFSPRLGMQNGTATGGTSSFAQKIRIESVSFGSSGADQRLIIKSYAAPGEAISVSGWTIETDDGSEVIPKVSNVYRAGGYAYLADVVLHEGDTLGVFSSVSPVNDNLRVNKCMGYLSGRYAFTPPLGVACYRPNAQELSGLSGQCRAVLSQITPCTEITAVPSPISTDDTSCRSFMQTLNYDGCVSSHQNDTDFLTGDSRVWIGVPFLSYPHGLITLRDTQGRVTTYSY